MKNLTIIIVLVILSSCSASWHVKRAKWKDPSLFEVKTETIINITKRDTLIRLDTLISIVLPRDTVTIEKLIPINRNFEKIVKKQGIITTEIEAVKGLLKVNSYLDSSFIYNLQTEIRIKNAIITNLKQVTKEQTITIEKQKSLIEGFKSNLKWILIVVCSVLVLGVGWKFWKWVSK